MMMSLTPFSPFANGNGSHAVTSQAKTKCPKLPNLRVCVLTAKSQPLAFRIRQCQPIRVGAPPYKTYSPDPHTPFNNQHGVTGTLTTPLVGAFRYLPFPSLPSLN